MLERLKVRRLFQLAVALAIVCLPMAGMAEVLEFDEQTAAIDTEVTFTLYLDSPPKAASDLSLDITYDGDVLEFVKADFAGTVLEKFDTKAVTSPESGTLSLNAKTGSNAIAAGATGMVVMLTFTVVGDDDTDLEIENLKGGASGWSAVAGIFEIFIVPAT